ncbi:MAG: hypothetical protein DRI57_03090 [Deltaproteobacteria bacterium]|nr:MAG: hypothetical protein DRI57_03090 [Deltaproteobacteria bacterium]
MAFSSIKLKTSLFQVHNVIRSFPINKYPAYLFNLPNIGNRHSRTEKAENQLYLTEKMKLSTFQPFNF